MTGIHFLLFKHDILIKLKCQLNRLYLRESLEQIPHDLCHLPLQQQKPIEPWEMPSLWYSSELWQILWCGLQHISPQLITTLFSSICGTKPEIS